MPIEKVSFEDSLGRFVLPNECIGCATCVLVCPFSCLDYEKDQPKIVKECKVCGICAKVCPKFETSMSELERLVFGTERSKEEVFGIHRRIFIAQTTDETIRKVCQDGGVVTSLLVFALKHGMINGAVVSGISEEEPLKPVPVLATNVKDCLGCAGTRYTYSPNMLALKEAVLKKRSLAFVGTPCQITAIRKIKAIPLRKYTNAITMTIGLFCSESFTYEGFIKECIRERMGINPRDVKKINIKGKFLVETTSDETKTFPLKEAKKYVSKGCASCPDFSAELSDISVGGLGLDGWTLTIIRTETGEKVFRKTEEDGFIRTRPIKGEKHALDLLIKISKRKRRVSQENA